MKGVVYEWYLQKMFGRNGVILELVVRWPGALRPTFIEVDVVVIMALL